MSAAARKRSLPLAAALLLAACGGGGAPGTRPGLRVVVESDAAFTKAPDFESRLYDTVDVALRYWGGSWSDVDGRSITLFDTAYVACGAGEALGCYDGDIRLTTVDPGAGTFTCIEQTTLVHEIGHAVLGDPDHTDPRWMQMDAVASELSGRPGYSDEGPAPCTPYVSVWRHPLDSP